jgi:DNA-binding response OmpR family regulator
MPVIDPAKNELTLKVVYHGPVSSGKATNLQWLYDNAAEESAAAISTGPDGALTCEMLSPGGSQVTLRLKLCVLSSTASTEHAAAILDAADGIVFVCNSAEGAASANAECLMTLRALMPAAGLDPRTPCVYQFNKRDLPDAADGVRLAEQLAIAGAAHFEAIANRGIGVAETLQAVVHLVLDALAGEPEGPPSAHDSPSTERPFSAGALRAHFSGVRELATEDVLSETELPNFQIVPPMLRTLLIAAKDASARDRISYPLEQQGFTVHCAGDGAAAWALTREHHPWLVVVDAQLPLLDGVSFCRRLRASRVTRHTPVVLLAPRDTDPEDYRDVGADDIVSCGTPLAELLARLHFALRRYESVEASMLDGGISGAVEALGAEGVLRICDQSKVTGTMVARRSGDAHDVEIRFREGRVTGARAREKQGLTAIEVFIAWDHGRFEFVEGDPGSGDPLAASLDELMRAASQEADPT